jgi:hypothetical protein
MGSLVSQRSAAALIVSLSLCSAAPIAAADLWTNYYPGVDYLYRVEAGQVIHMTEVNLAEEALWIRVSREGEGPSTPSAQAALLGSALTINGDWSTASNTRPYGLSVGNGWPWTDAVDPPNPPHSPDNWIFLACTTEKSCFFDERGLQRNWLPIWQNVVGGNEAKLVEQGVGQYYNGAFYTTDRHPRTGVCLDATGDLLRIFVVQGRRSDSLGMSFTEMTDLMLSFGCSEGMMLDGGGSSGMVLDGALVNERPTNEPNERVVTNHLSVMYTPSFDGACTPAPNSRSCSADILNICQGGQHEELDCGFFSATCEEDLGTAYCVLPACSAGGNSSSCDGSSELVVCSYGQAQTFNCDSFFGATCEEGFGTAYCVDSRCTAGGNARWCDGPIRKECAMGLYSQEVCTSGNVCLDGDCVPPEGGDDDDSGADDDDDDDDSGLSNDDDSAAGNDSPPPSPGEGAGSACACEAAPTEFEGYGCLLCWGLFFARRRSADHADLPPTSPR